MASFHFLPPFFLWRITLVDAKEVQQKQLVDGLMAREEEDTSVHRRHAGWWCGRGAEVDASRALMV
jgi:hypothetical protein